MFDLNLWIFRRYIKRAFSPLSWHLSRLGEGEIISSSQEEETDL
jgi:hypothetical protein